MSHGRTSHGTRSPFRRFQFQLTPLLDLLLIVIFAQYLDVREQAQAQTARAEQRLDASRRTLAQQREELARQHAEQTAQAAEVQLRMNEVLEQQRRAADLVTELFQIPPELAAEALRPLPADAPPRSPAERERLRKRFEELAALRGSAVVEHLIAHEELRKRADVWRVRVGGSGEIQFAAGDRTQSFRADTPKQFADRLYDRYKTLPTPKGLVILLVSYGDARADARQAVLAGLPVAIRLLREDGQGRTQFEYAIVGYTPDP